MQRPRGEFFVRIFVDWEEQRTAKKTSSSSSGSACNAAVKRFIHIFDGQRADTLLVGQNWIVSRKLSHYCFSNLNQSLNSGNFGTLKFSNIVHATRAGKHFRETILTVFLEAGATEVKFCPAASNLTSFCPQTLLFSLMIVE